MPIDPATLTGNWSYPTEIRFGPGRILELAEACQAAGILAPLFVTDPGLKDLPMVAAALAGLRDAGLRATLFSDLQPNPLVAGRGLARLRETGIEVSSGLLEAQARELNKGFVRRMEGGLPWLRAKSAMSLDGRTAMASGESQWITGADARADVQRLRAQSCAIISGVETVVPRCRGPLHARPDPARYPPPPISRRRVP